MRIDRDNIKIILILLVVSLSLGYAYINSDLNINGTAQVKHANWDVHWANIQVKTGSVSASTPTISNQTTVTYSVTLTNPGDYYEFTVDAVNGGQLDAMIDTIDSKLNNNPITNLPAYLNYSVTYSDGAPLEQNHELKANTTETYKVKLEYRTDIELNQLPTTNQTLNLQFTVAYRQATSDSEPVNHGTVVYTVSLTESYIGQAMSGNITQYSSAQDAIAAFSGNPFYLKHIIRDGIIEESYVEFVVTQAMAQANPGMTVGTYSLRGFAGYDENASSTGYCKAEYYDSTNNICLNPYYESNKQVLLSAFGNSNCDDEYTDYCYCSVPGVTAYTYSDGFASSGSGSWFCNINYTGQSLCGIAA